MNHSVIETITVGIIGFLSTVFAFSAEKVFNLVLGVSYINPQAKEFMLDLAPFIGAGTGLATFIWIAYKIAISHTQLRQMKDKDKNNKQPK